MRYAILCGCWMLLCQPATVAAQQQSPDRYYDENGIRYRETRTIVQQPVRDVRYVDQAQTYYLQRYRTDVVNRTATRFVPHTQYECVARLHDWWTIFGEPYVAYHLEPATTWRPQTQTAAVPVTRRELVPQTRNVKVAVPYLRFEAKEQVSRVAVGPRDSSRVADRTADNSTIPMRTTPPAPTYRPAAYPPNPGYATQQPTFIPVGARPAAFSFDPYGSNPFGGWSMVARRNGVSLGTGAVPALGYSYAAAGGGVPRLGSRYGGIARLDGDFPRYGTGSGEQSTFQAPR